MQRQKNKTKPPFDPRGEIFRWGPVPGKFFYLSVFTEVHYKHFRKKYGENWSETLWFFRKGSMLWLNEAQAVEEAGRRVFLKLQLPKSKRAKIYKEWQGYVKSLNLLYKKIDGEDLQNISNAALLKFWNDFHKFYIKFWVSGSVPELANYGSVPVLEGKLSAYIPDAKLRAHSLELLTAPTRLSFYQEEEVDLSKSKNIAKHQQQYYWLKNSYAGTQILPVGFFSRRKASLSRNLEKTMAAKLIQTAAKKKEIQRRYRLDGGIMNMAEAISNGVAWQDERKKYIFIALHYTDMLAKEIARRFGYKFKEFDNLWYFEAANIIKGKNFHKEASRRKAGFGVQFFHSCKQFSPAQTAFLWRAYETKHLNQKQIEVQGVIASKGKGKKLTGRIHILLDPSKTKTFKQGEILVAPMTSPEYIFAMRKAGAILTDTGGLTSHAAIVSRELGVPCFVGTKLATKVFKNGDMVEIDPQTGTARKI